jgi:tetratricopeptide (TPR) repeat protein
LASAYYSRGQAYSCKGDHEKAITDFKKAIKFEPFNAVAKSSLEQELREKRKEK